MSISMVEGKRPAETTTSSRRRIVFYHPGMFRIGNRRGAYPAVSLTGSRCELSCDHCRGRMLETMFPVETPESLLKKGYRLAEKGHLGMLISGGCRADGTLPWEMFLPAIRELKRNTTLHISIHTGFISEGTACRLKEAGVDQALFDLIGNASTLEEVYHIPAARDPVGHTLEALSKAELPMIPHIIAGLHFGRFSGEYHALELLERYRPAALVIVALMPLRGTPMAHIPPPDPPEILRLIERARRMFPHTPLALGCARDRTNIFLEREALMRGIDRLALPSEETVEYARAQGFDVRFQPTCCSLDLREDAHV